MISSLDLLNKLNVKITNTEKKKLIDYLYDLVIDSKSNFPEDCYGFRGSKLSNTNSKSNDASLNYCEYECAHIAQTYTALCCLLILGDDLSRLDTTAILKGIQLCQKDNGRYVNIYYFFTKNNDFYNLAFAHLVQEIQRMICDLYFVLLLYVLYLTIFRLLIKKKLNLSFV